MTDNPLKTIGYTTSGKPILGGAFQLADTIGVPLWFSIDQATERNCVISIPHYFASAMEHGWDDEKTFGKIREAYADRGMYEESEHMKGFCIRMFMDVAEKMPGKPATEIGNKMREAIESNPELSDRRRDGSLE